MSSTLDAAHPMIDPTATDRVAATRRRLFAALGLGTAAIAAAAGLYWVFIASRYVSTDNAYVDAPSAQVTPLVAAAVRQVTVIETQKVEAGDILVVLDDTDAKIALAKAEGQLAQAERRVRAYFANDTAFSGQVEAREAEIAATTAQIASAESDLARARSEYDRRRALAASGAVSGEEMTTAQTRLRAAEAALQSARAAHAQAIAQRRNTDGARQANKVLIAGANIDTNPEVLVARSQMDAARLDLERTVIRAPLSGVIARKSVEVGQRVAIGAPLMTIVGVAEAYVNANFKEVQLRDVRAGQSATVTSDLHGDGVTYHGRVVGLAGGTGAAFALIPAQNATGNWIKVVQRLPVRIALDPQELEAHPLRVGLSMAATIDLASAPAAR